MSENSQQQKVQKYIQDIIEACKNDPSRTEVAIANFKSLLSAMQKYEQAPRFFNDVLETAKIRGQVMMQNPYNPQPDAKAEADPHNSQIMTDFEQIIGKKVKQSDLQSYGAILSAKNGIKLDRETKRSKISMIQWFATNWTTLRPSLIEYLAQNPQSQAQN